MTQLDPIRNRLHESAGREQARPGFWEQLAAFAIAHAQFATRDLDEVVMLEANTAASLPSCRRGLEVEVLEGSVLLTERGDPDDHVLGPGDRVHLGPRGVAAMAFSPARLRIRARAAARTVPQSLPWNGATFGSSSR